MSQHDNGRRPAGHQGEAWQQGHQGRPDYASAQQEQSPGGRYGGQQGGHREPGGYGGHQNQFDSGRQQHGDNWRDQQGPRGGQRPGPDERDAGWNASRGGQGSFGGQASDNDYGNRGITESGNFGNYDASGRSVGSGGPRGQRHPSEYRQGYDARGESLGNYGPDNGDNRSGSYGGADWSGSARSARDNARWRGSEGYSTYGHSSADRGTGYNGGRDAQWPDNQDRYGERGYQGNWQSGQGGQSYHDPDYHQWRGEQLRQLDRDYDEWRQHRYQRFSDEFNDWRSNRGGGQAQGSTNAASAGSRSAGASKSDVTAGSADAAKSTDASSASASTKQTR